jgi:hypothetical protein
MAKISGWSGSHGQVNASLTQQMRFITWKGFLFLRRFKRNRSKPTGAFASADKVEKLLSQGGRTADLMAS